MGYCIEQLDQVFFISGEHNPNTIIDAVRNAFNKEKIGWVRKNELDDIKNLDELFECFRWEIEYTNTDINYIYFVGEKLGDDIDFFLNVIAQYVKDGSYIEMLGEDGDRWRYLFKDGKMIEKMAKTLWED